jgi:hypothetical protein
MWWRNCKFQRGVEVINSLNTPTEKRAVRIVTLPHFNDAQAAYPAVARHVDFLREAGVTVLLGDGGFTPHKPKQGDVDAFPWQAGLQRPLHRRLISPGWAR